MKFRVRIFLVGLDAKLGWIHEVFQLRIYVAHLFSGLHSYKLSLCVIRQGSEHLCRDGSRKGKSRKLLSQTERAVEKEVRPPESSPHPWF